MSVFDRVGFAQNLVASLKEGKTVENNGGQYSTIGRTFSIAFTLTTQEKPGIL